MARIVLEGELAGAAVERVLTAGAYDAKMARLYHTFGDYRGQARCVARRVHQVAPPRQP